MENISFGIAFLAGFLSFLSPCVLPLVPGYISYISGVSLDEMKGADDKKRVWKKSGLSAIFFVLGFSCIFIAYGASATFIGKALQQHLDILAKVAGVVIVILGIHLTGLIKIKPLNKSKTVQIKKVSPGYLGSFLIGLAFAFGWTPCVGPILAGILAIAATKNTMLDGVLLLASYSLGLGIPFIVTGFAVGAFLKVFEKYKKFIRFGEIVAGIFLIVIGVLIFTNKLVLLIQFIPEGLYKFSK